MSERVMAGVKMALVQNRRLLILRRGERESLPGIWECAGGGLEPHENLLDCARREAAEEAGLELEDIEIMLADIFKNRRGGRTLLVYYLARGLGEARLSDEHQEMRWVTLDEARMLLWPPITEVFDRYGVWERLKAHID